MAPQAATKASEETRGVIREVREEIGVRVAPTTRSHWDHESISPVSERSEERSPACPFFP
jgi:8-oxo-dGTP pyrophosphatase MutT (NUDIX family)